MHWGSAPLLLREEVGRPRFSPLGLCVPAMFDLQVGPTGLFGDCGLLLRVGGRGVVSTTGCGGVSNASIRKVPMGRRWVSVCAIQSLDRPKRKKVVPKDARSLRSKGAPKYDRIGVCTLAWLFVRVFGARIWAIRAQQAHPRSGHYRSRWNMPFG